MLLEYNDSIISHEKKPCPSKKLLTGDCQFGLIVEHYLIMSLDVLRGSSEIRGPGRPLN